MFLYLSEYFIVFFVLSQLKLSKAIIIFISGYFCFVLLIKAMATATIRFQISLYVYFAITFT